MHILRFRKGRFKIARSLLSRDEFAAWISDEGRQVHFTTYTRVRHRWFFGKRRAARQLLASARIVFATKGIFCTTLESRLDDLPTVIRSIAAAIRNRGRPDLYSADASKGLVVIPRGVVANDFAIYLVKKLGDGDRATRLPGLAPRLLTKIAIEAEELFFTDVMRGRQHIDASGRGAVVAADPDFRWRLGHVDGHYYYGYCNDNLADRKIFKQFRSEMEEVLHGQAVHLKRLQGHKRAELVASFKER